ncbi:hypothetical protein SADUNF_Sadunf16G0252100 [Salix dunnii]|uniref:Uncharacterized protein n=1 Tax=Salix dunnii TaxID=1413687 RepID=A0A835J8N5_9ROSI|nr:hypothetical protein SADUNF_Sadunf16G0252100 [Salix dunnii]
MKMMSSSTNQAHMPKLGIKRGRKPVAENSTCNVNWKDRSTYQKRHGPSRRMHMGGNISEGDQEISHSLAIFEKAPIRKRNVLLEFISHPIPTEKRVDSISSVMYVSLLTNLSFYGLNVTVEMLSTWSNAKFKRSQRDGGKGDESAEKNGRRRRRKRRTWRYDKLFGWSVSELIKDLPGDRMYA